MPRVVPADGVDVACAGYSSQRQAMPADGVDVAQAGHTSQRQVRATPVWFDLTLADSDDDEDHREPRGPEDPLQGHNDYVDDLFGGLDDARGVPPPSAPGEMDAQPEYDIFAPDDEDDAPLRGRREAASAPRRVESEASEPLTVEGKATSAAL